MWDWDLSEYVDKAYDQAVETFLWSESHGCTHPDESECTSVCDSSFMKLGYHNSDTAYSPELREALEGLIMLYWPALATMNMHPDDFGHNFILSANGHGTGFWDRGYGKIGEQLTADCRPHEGMYGYVDYDTGLVNITL